MSKPITRSLNFRIQTRTKFSELCAGIRPERNFFLFRSHLKRTPQGMYNAGEYTFPSDEISELQNTGSLPGSQAPILQYATNYGGERIQPGTSYLPETNLRSNPIMNTAEEYFFPSELTNEIEVPGINPRSSEAILSGHQGMYNAGEYTTPSHEINELQTIGSLPGSQVHIMQDATNSWGEGVHPGMSYMPESTLISNPMTNTAEENFSPIQRTNEIVVPGINPRSNENIFNLQSFATYFRSQGYPGQVYTEPNPWESNTSNVKQGRNDVEEHVFLANETNQFEFTENRVRSGENLLNLPSVNIFSGPQRHPLPAYSYPQTGLLNYDTRENVFSSQISSSTCIGAHNSNQNTSSHMQDCFQLGTSYCPETALNNQQSMNIAGESVFPSQQFNEFEVTEGSGKSTENMFDLSHSFTSFRFQDNALPHYFYSEPKFWESGMSNELQRKNSAKENVFQTDKTNQFGLTGNTEGLGKKSFKLLPDNIALDPQPHSLGTYSIPESGSKECGKSDEKCESQVPFNVNSAYKTGEKRHECATCKKIFPFKSWLQIHERIHKGERPYECKTCAKTFIVKSQLERHQRVHTGEKPYKCETCKKTFNDSSNLKKHVLVHTRRKPYECEICKRFFNQKSTLNTHLLTHTAERPFKCEVCHRSFRRKQDLTIHDRSFHKEDGL